MVFVTFSSLFSFEGMKMGSFALRIPHLDKLVHFVFYLVMFVTAFFVIKDHFLPRLKLRTVLWGVLSFTIIYGMIIEVLQYTLTVNRQGDIMDALANSMGAIVGLMLTKSLIYKGGSLK
jgi:VanZ family protein